MFTTAITTIRINSPTNIDCIYPPPPPALNLYGLEFCNTPFDNFCKIEGIVRHHTVRHTPQQNGVAERMNQTLMTRARDVTFDESAILGQSKGCESFAGTKDYGFDQKLEPQVEPVEEEADKTGTGVEDFIAVRQEKRNAPRQARYAGCVNTYDIDYVVYALAVGDDIGSDDPKTYKEAMASKDAENWIIAMNEEIQSLEKNKTWDLVTLPKGVKPVAMVGAFNLELKQLDVKTAFFYGYLEERIYMSRPKRFYNSRDNHVCLFKKSLYGLKQSPRKWYKRFDSFMLSNGCIRNQFDNYVYSKKVSRDSYVYLLMYVDDMLIAAKNMVVINDLKALLKSEFEMKDLGTAKKILGMEIWHDRNAGRLWVSQEKYTEKVLQAFFVDQSKPASTPLAAHFNLDQSTIPGTDKEVKCMKTVPYSSVVGSLMYAMVCTRPDLAHTVSVVSRFMANPGKAHWKAVKWILQWSVSWKSTLQPTVALSTTKAKYIQSALSLAKNPVYHERTKHIDVRWNFIRDVLEEDRFFIDKIATEHNPADMLTKALPTEMFEHCLNLLIFAGGKVPLGHLVQEGDD
nr:putative polyprotein [Tanacetum cinerariifolium]